MIETWQEIVNMQNGRYSTNWLGLVILSPVTSWVEENRDDPDKPNMKVYPVDETLEPVYINFIVNIPTVIR